MDYEQNMQELEEIIKKLESGDVKFDEATALYERGAVICKELSKNFNETKGKISIIREELMGIIKEEELV